jgi:ankyrin repeat protein
MLKYHADVNAQDNDGQSSLHYAAAAAYQDVVQALIASPKININVKNKVSNLCYRL